MQSKKKKLKTTTKTCLNEAYINDIDWGAVRENKNRTCELYVGVGTREWNRMDVDQVVSNQIIR